MGSGVIKAVVSTRVLEHQTDCFILASLQINGVLAASFDVL
jgi:hypothetical protein